MSLAVKCSLMRLHTRWKVDILLGWGNIWCFWCVWTELVDKLKQQRRPNGAMDSIGPVVVEWVWFPTY